jgi:hypothetical protein
LKRDQDLTHIKMPLPLDKPILQWLANYFAKGFDRIPGWPAHSVRDHDVSRSL